MCEIAQEARGLVVEFSQIGQHLRPEMTWIANSRRAALAQRARCRFMSSGPEMLVRSDTGASLIWVSAQTTALDSLLHRIIAICEERELLRGWMLQQLTQPRVVGRDGWYGTYSEV